MSHYKDLLAILSHTKIYSGLIGLGKNIELRTRMYSICRYFSMTRVRCKENIITASDKRNLSVKYSLSIDAGKLFRKGTLWKVVVMIESSL
jgi:hypothetical protein